MGSPPGLARFATCFARWPPERQGLAVVRAWIAPDEFVAWCETQVLPRNAAARARWSSDFAHRVFARAPGG
jgi:hypothetical protein